MDIDLLAALLQEADDLVFHQIGQQRRKGIGAVVDHGRAFVGQQLFNQGIEPLRIDSPGVIHHRDMLGADGLVVGEGRVLLVGVVGIHRIDLALEPLGDDDGNETLTDTALALQDEMDGVLKVHGMSSISDGVTGCRDMSRLVVTKGRRAQRAPPLASPPSPGGRRPGGRAPWSPAVRLLVGCGGQG
ncbi:hypothetical protein D3C76_1125190 [compost metagenome]